MFFLVTCTLAVLAVAHAPAATADDDLTDVWGGNVESFFNDFRRLNLKAKRNLRVFQLSNAANLDLDLLMKELRPCTKLETIKLTKVDLLGKFPTVNSDKLDFPNLREFYLDLLYKPYPAQTLTCIDYLFVIKAGHDLLSLTAGVSFKVTQAEEVQCGLDYATGEFIVAGIALAGSAATVSTFLRSVPKDRKLFSLRELTLVNSAVETDLIPDDLSRVQVMFNSLDTDFNTILKKTNRVRQLQLSGFYSPEYEVDLSFVSPTVETITLQDVRVVSSTTLPRETFDATQSVFFRNCTVSSEIVDRFDDLFRLIRKFAMSWEQLGGQDPSLCFNFLNKIFLNSRYADYDYLDTVYVERCAWFDDEPIAGFLVKAGVPSGCPIFILERKSASWEWTGREVLPTERKRHHYDFQDWNNFMSFDYYRALIP